MTELTSNEQTRELLEQRCLTAMGGVDPLVAKVLSFFPDRAENFVRTQDYAFSIEGKRGIWESVQKNGRLESLWSTSGWETADDILETARVIKNLRGEGLLSGDRFQEDPYLLEKIITIFHQKPGELKDYDMARAKTLELLSVNAEDIGLLSNYVTASKEANSKTGEAKALRIQADKLSQEAKTVVQRSRETIAIKYPRTYKDPPK